MKRFLSAIVLVLLFGSVLTACLWRPLLHTPPLRDELIYAHTEDGWRIAMHRYHPRPGVERRATPIIISHGISANERTWSLTEEQSLPLYLAERGWEVWAIDLRAVGESDRPGLFNRKRYNYDFDTYVTQDLPAVIEEVRRQTGAPKVHWIGHSMGGMIMYAYVARFGDDKLKTITTVASPVGFHGLSGYMAWAQTQAPRFQPYLFTIRERAFIPGIAVFGGAFETRWEYLIWNYDNLDPMSVKRIMYSGSANMAGGVLRQFGGLFAGAPFTSGDGQMDYMAGLQRLTVPLHVTAGMADNLALVQNVIPAYHAAASEQKRFRVFARANGHTMDYGHVDLTVGNQARVDVYPELEEWIRRHD